VDDTQTLEAARIPPNNQDRPVLLFVEEHDPNATPSPEKQQNQDGGGGSGGAKPRQPEKGFKDTALYG
jgi:hypothetical protein